MRIPIPAAALSLLLISATSWGFSTSLTADGLKKSCTNGLKCVDRNQNCGTEDQNYSAICLLYISAFREGHAIGLGDGAASQLKSRLKPDQGISIEELYSKYGQFCLSNEITNVQLGQVFVRYMSDHPETLHRPALEQLYESLKLFFPCKKYK